MANITEISWENFEALSLDEKKPYLQRGGGDTMPYHTLFAQQFDRDLLERLCALPLHKQIERGRSLPEERSGP